MEQQPDAWGAMMQTFFMFGIIFLIFYFLLIRPQQKQRERHEDRINKLKKGDKIITSGGIYASIIGLKDDVAAIKINEETKIEIQKSAIAVILGDENKASKS